METSLAAMDRLGANLIDPIDLKTNSALEEAEGEVINYEFKSDLNAYLSSLGANAPVHTLQEIIEFNQMHADKELVWFGQEKMVKAQAKGPLTDQAYLDALARCRHLARDTGINAVMNKHNLDAIVAPTTSPAYVTDWVLGDHWLGGSTSLAAVAGYPSITVPAGFVSGLPVGISFFGRAWTEPKLLSIAFAFEHATKARRPPTFPASIGASSSAVTLSGMRRT